MTRTSGAARPRLAAPSRSPRRGVLAGLAGAVVVLLASCGTTTAPVQDAEPPASAVTEPAAAPTTAPGPLPEAPPASSGLQFQVRDASLDSMAVTGTAGPQPVRLQIPQVRIDMPIGPVGVAADGQMEVPEDAESAGWYRFGATAGEASGTAVVAAHVDSWETGVGPFAKLRYEVTPGTRVLVTTEDGAVREYEVVENRIIPKPELPVNQIFDRSGDHRLILVTCGGTFQRDVGRYTDNIVVTAVPVGA